MKDFVIRMRRSLREFLGWWWQEIISSLPPALRRSGAGMRPLLLRPANAGWLLSDVALESAARAIAPRHFAADQSASLHTACAGRRVLASLADSQVHRLQLAFPRSVTPSAEAVEYALLVQAPLTLDEVVFDWKKSSGSSDDMIAVEVGLARRADVEALKEKLSAAGVEPDEIGSAAADSSALDHVFHRSRGGVTRQASRVAGLIAIGVLAALATGALAHWQSRQIEQELASLRQQQQSGRAAQRDVASLRAVMVTLQPLMRSATRTATLNELARLLPANAWLLDVRFEHARLTLAGVARDPAAAARALAESTLITDVRLGTVSAPASPGAGSGFEITARLAGGS